MANPEILDAVPAQSYGFEPAPEAGAAVPYTFDATGAAESHYAYTSSRAVVDFCLDSGIRDVVYLDRSARAIYAGVAEYQRLAMPDQPRLGTYFLNPDTVKLREGMDADRHARMIEGQLRAARSPLLDKRADPLLLFDVCAHSGDSLGNTCRTLELVGFSAIKLGVLTDNTATRENSDLRLDFSFTTHKQPLDCQAFGRDERLVKASGSVFVGVRPSHGANVVSQQRQQIRAQVRASYMAGLLRSAV